MVHSDGGTRCNACSASAWILDVGMWDGERWNAHHLAMGGTFYPEPISSFTAECLAVAEGSAMMMKLVQDVIRKQ